MVAKWFNWVAGASEGLAVSRSGLRDIFDFVEVVRNLDLSKKRMFSLDATLLFTNSPISKTINYLCKFTLGNNIDEGVPVDELRQFLFKCTQNVQFKRNGEV